MQVVREFYAAQKKGSICASQIVVCGIGEIWLLFTIRGEEGSAADQSPKMNRKTKKVRFAAKRYSSLQTRVAKVEDHRYFGLIFQGFLANGSAGFKQEGHFIF